MSAATLCPAFSSEMPSITARPTDGWAERASSTSGANIFQPLNRMTGMVLRQKPRQFKWNIMADLPSWGRTIFDEHEPVLQPR